jgi:hypothetical protein
MAKIEKFCRTYPDAIDHSVPCSIATTIEDAMDLSREAIKHEASSDL